jgi:ParB-like chromosome segregation protein Spo0J
MSAETKKVLEMLAAGKISAEDAERLLDKLSGAAAQATETGAQNSQTAAGSGAAAPGNAPAAKRPKFLRIQVERPGREDVNVRVPLSVARGGRYWMAFLPVRVAEKLSEYGIDFASLDAMNDQDFQAAIDRINVDVQGRNGKRVHISAE